MNDRAFWLTQIQRYADGQLHAEEVAALVAALRRNGALRRDFLELLNLDAALVEHASGSAPLEEMVADLGLPSLANSLGSAVRNPARGSWDEAASKVTPRRGRPRSFSPVRGFLSALNRAGRDLRFAVAFVWIFTFVFAGVAAGVIAAVLAMVHSLKLPIEGPGVANSSLPPVDAIPPSPISTGPVARLVRTGRIGDAECTWAGESLAPQVGEDLVAGRELVLKSGLAEIIFTDGAQTILQGPATFVVRSRTSAVLNSGKCSVTVEHPLARGFAIHAPGMNYTDLGTEFGVLVAQTGEQEVHVFRGRVQAEEAASERQGAGSGHRASAPGTLRVAPRSMLLTAHQAISVAAPGGPMVQMAADEKRFVRAILDPFPIVGTGVGLDRGAPDPHWGITAISTEANFKPQRAVVAVPDQSYLPDNRDKGQWISNTQSRNDMPPACRWTLLTHFDLSGFDPSTARIEGQITADNFVIEVRVNGKAVPIPPVNRNEELFRRWQPLKIEEGFVAGDNTLEIVIENGDGTGPGNPQPSASPMALCLELKGLAQRSLKLKAKN